MINQPGMTWEKDRWDELTPVWSSEPSLDVIKRLCEEQLGLPVNISFWAEGGESIPKLTHENSHPQLQPTDQFQFSVQQIVPCHAGLLRQSIHAEGLSACASSPEDGE